MTALERLRELRKNRKPLTEALTEPTKAPSVSFGGPEVGRISKKTPPAQAWLEAVTDHLGIGVDAFMASGVILPTEVPDYLDRDPAAFAEAVRDLVALRCPLRSHATAVPSHLPGTVGLIALSDQPRNQGATLHLAPTHDLRRDGLLQSNPARQPRWLSDIDPLRSNKHHDVTQ